MKSRIVLFIFFICSLAYAQDKIDSSFYPTASTIKLNPNYIIDGIRLYPNDTIIIKQLEELLNIKDYKFKRNAYSNLLYGGFAQEGIFIKYSNFTYVVDRNILDSRHKKNKFWEIVSSKDISSIELLKNDEAIKFYGIKGENNVIRVKLANK